VKTVIIIQARMTSTRLPGKVLRTVLGKPLLAYQLERLQRVRAADEIVVATTVNETDDAIVNVCKQLNVLHFRGSEQDVLERYYQAAVKRSADTIVRITSDCPIIDPRVVNQVIEFYHGHTECAYVSNCLPRTYPVGMDTEVFPFEALEKAYYEAVSAPDREHVTGFIERQPEVFRQANVPYVADCSHYRWTVDTAEDFEVISSILTALYPRNPYFTLEDCLELLTVHPEWEAINSHVKQKAYNEK